MSDLDANGLARADEPWWEPPLAGTEIEHLVGALDRLRATFRWKADGLDDEALRLRLPSSALTLGGLLKHLAATEDHHHTVKLRGEPMGEPWSGRWPSDEPDWDFTSAADDTAQQLYALYDGAVARSRHRLRVALEAGSLEQLVHAGDVDGRHASLRRLLFDLVEEYGRHTGHADLIREAVDGRVGEDPPAGWHP